MPRALDGGRRLRLCPRGADAKDGAQLGLPVIEVDPSGIERSPPSRDSGFATCRTRDPVLTLSYYSTATACCGGRSVNRILFFAPSFLAVFSIAPFAAQAATAGWPDTVDRLNEERSQAQTCVDLLPQGPARIDHPRGRPVAIFVLTRFF